MKCPHTWEPFGFRLDGEYFYEKCPKCGVSRSSKPRSMGKKDDKPSDRSATSRKSATDSNSSKPKSSAISNGRISELEELLKGCFVSPKQDSDRKNQQGMMNLKMKF